MHPIFPVSICATMLHYQVIQSTNQWANSHFDITISDTLVFVHKKPMINRKWLKINLSQQS